MGVKFFVCVSQNGRRPLAAKFGLYAECEHVLEVQECYVLIFLTIPIEFDGVQTSHGAWGGTKNSTFWVVIFLSPVFSGKDSKREIAIKPFDPGNDFYAAG